MSIAHVPFRTRYGLILTRVPTLIIIDAATAAQIDVAQFPHA